MTQIRRNNRRGFALLAVMWLSVAIASVTLAFALEARHNRIAVTSLSESTQALAAARAGIATTLSRLDYLYNTQRLPGGITPSASFPISKDDPWQWADSLLRDRVDLGGPGYTVYVRTSGATMSLRYATDVDWRNFLRGMRFDAALADRLAQSIMDWSDADNAVRANGAERDAYISAGRVLLPTNRPFGTVDELRNVMGMTPFVYDSIAPYLTVTNFAGITVNAAPAPVLRTVTGFTNDVVSVILSQRAAGRRFASMEELVARLPSSTAGWVQNNINNQLFFTTGSVEITSIGWAAGGRTRVVSTVLAARVNNRIEILGRKDE